MKRCNPVEVITIKSRLANVLRPIYAFQGKGKVKIQVLYKIWKTNLELCKTYIMYILSTKPPSLSCKNAGWALRFLLLLFSSIIEGLMQLSLESGRGFPFKSEVWIKDFMKIWNCTQTSPTLTGEGEVVASFDVHPLFLRTGIGTALLNDFWQFA